MTQVWLTHWEWACCGDAFACGDDVDFGVRTRAAHSVLADELGADLAATVDAIESHHEEEFPDRVRGRVTAVNVVTREVRERRSLRKPGHGAPLSAEMPAAGEAWPNNRMELGNGVWAGARPSRYVIEVVPVPGTVALSPVRGVRLSEAESDDSLPSFPDSTTVPRPERTVRVSIGWLVDVDEE
ncbi:hypothetical protein FHX48_002611 [Microbacterium halimionae]|uniref:Uncharacterized protein n=1 Tax=Microbacterium halimionae TaxID=1526413 RepID=A0A7W3JR81_9MICO|nr:DUF6578 domain-containing protein [Microbacterium halimionae]MBA8817506.1 hypothetical protein [Microbacterium halimionae]NII95051.1 hypothetical protein [Microbacterium halimionae]